MNIIHVTKKEQLDMLYNGSACTLEGLPEASIKDILEAMSNRGFIKDDNLNNLNVDVYSIKGYLMNYVYGLTGYNAYPDDITIVCIPLDFMKNISEFAVTMRFEYGYRWFDDIVDNNARREEEQAEEEQANV